MLEEVAPGKKVQSDQDVLEWIRGHANLIYHASATCGFLFSFHFSICPLLLLLALFLFVPFFQGRLFIPFSAFIHPQRPC